MTSKLSCMSMCNCMAMGISTTCGVCCDYCWHGLGLCNQELDTSRRSHAWRGLLIQRVNIKSDQSICCRWITSLMAEIKPSKTQNCLKQVPAIQGILEVKVAWCSHYFKSWSVNNNLSMKVLKKTATTKWSIYGLVYAICYESQGLLTLWRDSIFMRTSR